MGIMRTKIAVTIGPSSGGSEIISKIMEIGCNIFRINFSHGSAQLWAGWVKKIRETAEKHGVEVTLIGDLKGRSLRFGDLKMPLSLKAGDKIKLVYGEITREGEAPLQDQEIINIAREGDVIVTDDGRGMMKVVGKGENSLEVEILNDIEITSRKSLVIRGKEPSGDKYYEINREAIEFAAEHDFDFLGLSFVRSVEDVRAIRDFLDKRGIDIGLIAKIETPSAVYNLRELARECDAILVARGDLGMYFPLEEIPYLQSKIVEITLGEGRPVMVATQLLGSMIREPVPSRSEIIDVVNCVRDGVDVLMLTGETAVGKYPVEAVRWLKKIIEKYEVHPRTKREIVNAELVDKFALGIVSLAENLSANIGIYTKSGNMARRIARYRPATEVIAATNSLKILRRMNILWGVKPVRAEAKDYSQGLEELERRIKTRQARGEALILTYGLIDEPVHIVKIIQTRDG